MKLFYYMASTATGVKTVYADCFYLAYLGIKSMFGSNTTFVIWDENDEIRIFHGGY